MAEQGGLLFTKTTGLITTEDGDTDYFTVALTLEPRHDVVLTFTISNGGEGKFQASGNTITTLTFTAANWNTPQTVTLVGVDDGTPRDENTTYNIQTQVSSDDLRYAGMGTNSSLPIPNIAVTNVDNDAPDEWYGDAGGVVTVDYWKGGNGTSDLYGRDGRDELYGYNGNDRLYGGYGDDVLWGDADNDVLEGDQGNDKLNGGTGNDNLKGGTGEDTLLGGNGNDMLNGGEDADSMDGGNGADTYYVDNTGDIVSDTGTDTGTDTVYVTAFLANGYTLGKGIDNATLNDQANNASVTGNAGNNSVIGNASNNAMDGGAGADTLAGGAGADNLTGGAGADSLKGGDGNDILYAGAGSDAVNGDSGNDVIVGGGGAGNNQYNGGTGTDTVQYTSVNIAITVKLNEGTATGTEIGSDVLAQIENVTGGKGNDAMIGNASANKLDGYTGNDAIDGGAGNDTMLGGLGNDTYYVRESGDQVTETTTAGTDAVLSYLSSYTLTTNVEVGRIKSTGNASLTGNASSNTLYGGAGNNTLSAGAGNDVLAGELGADKLIGGTGADRFDFNFLTELGLTTTTRDTIADFKTSEADKIDLQGVDANTALAGDQAFSFLGTATFTGNATGKLRLDATAHILYGSTDADTTAEFAIVLTGVNSLAGTDFVL